MIAFEYTELDAENCTNVECIKILHKAGRSFKVIYKAVPEEWENVGKRGFNLVQNEILGHYDIPNSFSVDEDQDTYEKEAEVYLSTEDKIVEREEFDENVVLFRKKMQHFIEKAPKIAYGVLLVYSGSKGADFAAKLRLKHEGGNNVRKVAEEILYNGLMNLDVELVQCKKTVTQKFMIKRQENCLCIFWKNFKKNSTSGNERIPWCCFFPNPFYKNCTHSHLLGGAVR